MVSCPKCSTQNSLDSLFCRKCGAGFSAELLEAEQAKLTELVGQGMEALNEGRTDEAWAIAETSVLTNPAYANGFALKAMVHERRGEYAEALDAMESVVALNPESTIDRIKLNQLRSTITKRAEVTAVEPDKRIAWISGLSAAALVVCVAVAAVRFGMNSKPTVVQSSSGLVASNSNPGLNNGIQSPVNTQQTQAPNNTNPAPPTNAAQPGPGDVPAVGQGTQAPKPPRIGTGLPNVRPGDTMGTVPPLTVQVDGTLPSIDPNRQSPAPQPGPAKQPSPDPDVAPVTQPAPQKPKDNPGRIEITVSNKQDPKPNNGGSESVDSGNNRENMLRIGNEMYKAGDFAGAARAYEQALSLGGDSGSLNQRLGGIYRRLGKSSEAINAYQKAISVYEQRIQSGKGDPDANQRALEVCQQALKVLRG